MAVADSRPTLTSDDRAKLDAYPADPGTLVPQETGTRIITSLFGGVTNGQVYLEREGRNVEITFYDLQIEGESFPSIFTVDGTLPDGFRPPKFTSFGVLTSSTQTIRLRFDPNGRILLYSLPVGNRLNGTFTFKTRQTFPTSPYPGLPY